MEIFLSFFLAFLVGLSLGVIGSGGAILTVPILIYIVGIDMVAATSYSLFIVGGTALVGAVRNAFNKQINYRALLLFGMPSMAAAYFSRAFLIPALPDVIFTIPFTLLKGQLLLLLFALVMTGAAIKMIRADAPKQEVAQSDAFALVAAGIMVGILAGALGAGGGFLIIPVLVFRAGLPMKTAVGTSLSIITIQSIAGFLGDVDFLEADWHFLGMFSGASILGIFLGMWFNNKADAHKLKVIFGYFVLVMALLIFIAEWQKLIA